MVVGCSHSGVDAILEAARDAGEPKALLGGLHGFDDFHLLEGLDLLCPVHCTKREDEIRKRFPEACVEGGAGRVIEWPAR